MDSSYHNLKSYSWVVIIVLVAIVSISVIIQGCIGSTEKITTDAEPDKSVADTNKIGYPAPDFTLIDLDGNTVQLSELKGKVVFINFWASWCPPCRAEMPEIGAIYQKYKTKGVVVLGVDLLEPEDWVRQYVQKGGFNWTFVVDTTGEVAAAYNIIRIPTSFFIDTEGVIRSKGVGDMTMRTMEAHLKEAMK